MFLPDLDIRQDGPAGLVVGEQVERAAVAEVGSTTKASARRMRQPELAHQAAYASTRARMVGETSGNGSPRAMRSAMPWMSEPGRCRLVPLPARSRRERLDDALGSDGVAETGEMVELRQGGFGGVAAGPGHERVALVEDPEDGRDARVGLALVGVAVVAVAGDGGLGGRGGSGGHSGGHGVLLGGHQGSRRRRDDRGGGHRRAGTFRRNHANHAGAQVETRERRRRVAR